MTSNRICVMLQETVDIKSKQLDLSELSFLYCKMSLSARVEMEQFVKLMLLFFVNNIGKEVYPGAKLIISFEKCQTHCYVE